MRSALLAILLSVGLSVLAQETAAPVAASTPTSADADEANLVARLAKVREDLAAAERTRGERETAVNRSLTELRKVENQIAERNRTLRQLADEAAALEAKLTELIAERASQETQLSAQKESLAALLRSTYALGRLDTLKLVLAQDQLADTGRLLAYQAQLQQVRLSRIGLVRDLLKSLDALKLETETARAELDTVRAAEAENLAALQEERRRKANVLAQLKTALAQAEAQVEALDSDRSDIEGLLAQLRDVIGDVPALLPEDRPFAELKGRLPRPLSGKVLVGFGQEHLGRASAGVRIEAARGAQIRAVARGRVAFADWLRGYGLLLILDHGDGYMSLYGRCESLLAAEGEWVEANAAIALAGDSGGASATGLYFELRHRGQALDPAGWWGR
ncbi:MAG: peptidoglycan DD-metalloendopeptidase family protein [Rhodanobacteraceae bacterium]|nr:peptidoglycan DD-metalloendopeptidase family protein [Rhodanobacteraceae bacterium]